MTKDEKWNNSTLPHSTNSMVEYQPDNHIAALLVKTSRRLEAALTQELKKIGLSLDEWFVLELLVANGGRSMGQIAASLRISLTRATKLIDRMVSSNLVYRQAHEKDKRVVVIIPSDAGVLRMHSAKSLVTKHQKAIDESDDGGLPILRAQLERLLHHLDIE